MKAPASGRTVFQSAGWVEVHVLAAFGFAFAAAEDVDGQQDGADQQHAGHDERQRSWALQGQTWSTG